MKHEVGKTKVLTILQIKTATQRATIRKEEIVLDITHRIKLGLVAEMASFVQPACITAASALKNVRHGARRKQLCSNKPRS